MEMEFKDDIMSGLVRGCYILDTKLILNILEAIYDVLSLDRFNNWEKTDKSMAFLFEVQKGLDALEEL
jgi:hypothetical protein